MPWKPPGTYLIKCRTKTVPMLRSGPENRGRPRKVYRWTKWHPVKQCSSFAQAVEEYDHLENEPGLPTEVASRPPTQYAVFKGGKRIYP